MELYSKTPPGDNPYTDAANLVTASRLGQRDMADAILERVRDKNDPGLLSAMAAMCVVILEWIDSCVPGQADVINRRLTEAAEHVAGIAVYERQQAGK